jgi:hypothetical protein
MERKISASGELLRTARIKPVLDGGDIVHRATYCAIARIKPVLNGGNQCTGRPTAPIITRYRCFLPDLAGLAGLRRVGPGTGTSLPLQTLPSLATQNPIRAKLADTIPHNKFHPVSKL